MYAHPEAGLNVVCSETPEVTGIFLKYTFVFSKLPEVQDLFLKTAISTSAYELRSLTTTYWCRAHTQPT